MPKASVKRLIECKKKDLIDLDILIQMSLKTQF